MLDLQEVRVCLILGKYVNEMFKVQNLTIYCNLPFTSIGDVYAACSTKHQSILPPVKGGRIVFAAA